MKLKKIILSSAISAVMMAGSVHAAESGQVSFLGAVTAKTCDIETVVDGAVNNLIQLGTVAVGQTGTEKEFTLKLKDAKSCDLAQAPAAFVTWNGSSLDQSGINNVSGDAKDAKIKLTAVNSKTPNTAINSTANDIEFVSANVKTDGGFKFKAQLVGGQQKGSVESAAAYAIRYQ